MIDVLNEDGEVINTISRELAELDNHITENVLVFVFNSQGKVWVQLRPKTKTHYPGMWDISACGGVVSGETHEQAAERETFEEMGIKVDLHFVESFMNIFVGDNGEERKRLSHLYVGVCDGLPQTNDEVDEFKSWEPNKLREDVETSPESYIPSFDVELDKAVKSFSQLPNK